MSLSRFRLRVLSRTFGFALFWITAIVAPGIWDFKIGSIIALGVLIIGTGLTALLDHRKFLVDVVAGNDKYLFTYLTSLARKKQLLIPRDKVINGSLKEKKLLVRDFDTIEINVGDNKIEFRIINDNMVHTCQNLIAQITSVHPEKEVVIS